MGRGDSPGKSAKIDKFIPQSNLPERLNLSMKIKNLKKGMLASLQIRTDNNVLYIVNENPTDMISLEPGFIVCGFGEGRPSTWRRPRELMTCRGKQCSSA